MIIFISVYILVYAALQFLLYLRLRPILPQGPRFKLFLAAWGIIMILTPPLLRFLDGQGSAPPWAWPGWLAYCWMGFVMVGTYFSVVSWMVGGLTRLFMRRKSKPLTRGLAFFVALATVCTMFYGFNEANRLKTTRLTLETSRIGDENGPVKVAFFADLHLGLVRRPHILNQLSRIVKQEKPDLILAGGDIVDGRLPPGYASELILREMKARFGKYAVLGNHEYYVGALQAKEFLKRSGFKVLSNKSVVINDIITLVGLDDPGRQGWSPMGVTLVKATIPKGYTILLKHRPVPPPETQGLFDLLLSGHTHGGQMIPMRYLVRYLYPYVYGLYDLPGGGKVYTTTGAGAWGPPLRVLAAPELVLITIKPKPKPDLQAGMPGSSKNLE